MTFFGNIRDQIRIFLESRVRDLDGFKWNLCLHVEMQRGDGEEIAVTSPYFRSRTYALLSVNTVNEHDVNEGMQKMYASLESFMREGSGWYLKQVLKLEINTVVYKPLGASAHFPLPISLAKSGSLLNIRNQDDKCFLYCLLASLHPSTAEPERVEQYLQYENEVNMTGITYPVTLSQIRKVENQNESLSINIFTYNDDNEIVPLRITERRSALHHINLLWLVNGELTHFCLILNLNRFLSRTKTHHSQLHFCCYCLHAFTKKTLLDEHQQYCSQHEAQRVELPVEGKTDILEFTDFEKTLKVPFVIYADYETVNRKLHTCQPNPNQSSITPTAKLEVCGFGYKVVCEDSQYSKPSVIYRGKDAGRKLIECLIQEEKEITEILSKVEPMQETDNIVTTASHCCICIKTFTTYDKLYGRIARHHNHLTGHIVGAACNRCNLNCKQAKFIPVIFHNLKNFDAHILCQNIGHFKNRRLSCIAQNTEKYISFSLGTLRFLDSFQFLPASIETLVKSLGQDGMQAFSHLLSEFDSCAEAELLLRKGVYMYEYMDSFDRFEEKQLPPKEEFYSSLKKEHISDEDYQHACKVFQTFDMTNLGDYHDLYLKTDVLLLSDIFESFRSLCLREYNLDPCHFYTSPGLSWSACLKLTQVRLELLCDIDKILLVEAGIRGGLSMVSTERFKRANNAYLPDYNPSEPSVFLQYLDANNLYGWAMVQPLPIGDFVFLNKRDIESFDIMSVPEDAHTGYILEVSLHYPKSLHNNHNCLPLAPVRRAISNSELSPYAQRLLRKIYGLSETDPLPNRGKVEKLLATLEDKDHYVLHYRNLQLYVSLGLKVKTIHRILSFSQEAWMKPYIDKNTRMRQKATSAFQRDFYKMLNCSVFGKTMENVRHHRNIELIHTEARMKKVTAKPAYKSAIFNEDLVAMELYKTKVKLMKPVYCGMCILDLSKCLMYDFWYNYIQKKYKSTAKLHLTDTDSFLYSCLTEDLYRDMGESMEEHFDTSDLPPEHFLRSDVNKKALGKFKDETHCQPISEFVGLRPKLYSFVCGNVEEKRAKGVAKVTVKKDLKHALYKNTLFSESKTICSMSSLRSHEHELFAETIQKTALSAFDDKIYLIDAVNGLAYGHYKITDNTNSDTDSDDDDSILVLPLTHVAKECDTSMKMLHEKAFTIGDFHITPCVSMQGGGGYQQTR